MSKILCIETATSVCSVALFDEAKILASREISEGFKHAEKVTVFIQEILSDTGLTTNELDAIAISSGPGSYTGLRIGMSVAKGICFASEVPLISVSTLELMAAGVINQLNSKEALLYCPMIDARRMEVYCALYDEKFNTFKTPSAIVVDEKFFNEITQPVYFFGDGAAKCKEVLSPNFIYVDNVFPSAQKMGALALKKFNDKKFANVSLIEPDYLKEFHPSTTKRL